MKHSNFIQEVQDQYEDYPYPMRDPEDEKKRLYAPFYDSLDLLNFYCFEGKKDFSKGIRALVAGGGTGDAAVYLAEQLRDTDSEIVYIDLSSASMAVAKARAEARGLTNITWIRDSLLEVPNLDIGTFDYINSSGVLHHLESPDAGLQALRAVLKDDGAMGIMVYGTHGRTGIYHIQEMMRLLNKNATSMQEKVENTKDILGILPQSNWYKMAEGRFNDVSEFGDIGVYDLFLHAQDCSYTVPEVYEWVERCGLTFLSFVACGGIAKALYNPSNYCQNSKIVETISELPEREQQAVAELIAGNFSIHSFYTAKQPKPVPTVDDLEMVPFFNIARHRPNIYQEMYQGIANSMVDEVFMQMSQSGNSVTVKRDKFTADLLKYMDGERSVGEIINCVFAEGKLKDNDYLRKKVHKSFVKLFGILNQHDWLLLRHQSIPAFKTASEMQALLTKQLEGVAA